MTVTFNDLPSTKLSLEYFISDISKNKAFENIRVGNYATESVEEISRKLSSIGNNMDELIGAICGKLHDPNNFQEFNDLQPPTFFIYSDERFSLRMVLWLPNGPQADAAPFSYYEPHDHNFDFFTVNIFGPGYRTVIFNYDYSAVKGISQEVVKLEYLEDTILSPGKVMFYQKSKDVHIQYPPESLSVSLNLIVQPGPKPNRQYEFEIDSNRPNASAKLITRNLDRFRFQKKMFLALMSTQSSASKELLIKIARTHQLEEVRAIAIDHLVRFSNDASDIEKFLDMASADPSKHVQAVAMQLI